MSEHRSKQCEVGIKIDARPLCHSSLGRTLGVASVGSRSGSNHEEARGINHLDLGDQAELLLDLQEDGVKGQLVGLLVESGQGGPGLRQQAGVASGFLLQRRTRDGRCDAQMQMCLLRQPQDVQSPSQALQPCTLSE